MLLAEIDGYFDTNRRVCLAELADRFDTASDAIVAMLDLLAAKGRITRRDEASLCGGCTKCDPADLVWYERRRPDAT